MNLCFFWQKYCTSNRVYFSKINTILTKWAGKNCFYLVILWKDGNRVSPTAIEKCIYRIQQAVEFKKNWSPHRIKVNMFIELFEWWSTEVVTLTILLHFNLFYSILMHFISLYLNSLHYFLLYSIVLSCISFYCIFSILCRYFPSYLCNSRIISMFNAHIYEQIHI